MEENININNMLKKISLVIITLCGLYFYQIFFLTKYNKYFHLLGTGIVIIVSIIFLVYDDSFRFKKNFTFMIVLIFISVIFSMYLALNQHDQSILLSLYEQRNIYYYLVYFLLHLIKVNPKDLKRIIIILGLIYVLFYFLQIVLFPFEIFETEIGESRGTLRIFLPGITFLMISYYYALQKFLESNKFPYFLLIILTLVIIILLGGRSLLAITVFVTVINLIMAKRIKSRVLIYFLIVASAVIIYFAFSNIFLKLIEETETTQKLGSSYVRIRALKFFFQNLFPNFWTYLFGNGVVSGRSEYGEMMMLYNMKYGFYLVDIGIFGNYINFGLIFVAGVFGLLWKIFKIKIQKEYQFIKFFFMVIALSLITGGGFSESEFIIPLCMSLYLLDVSHYYRMKELETDDFIEPSLQNQ